MSVENTKPTRFVFPQFCSTDMDKGLGYKVLIVYIFVMFMWFGYFTSYRLLMILFISVVDLTLIDLPGLTKVAVGKLLSYL